MSDYSQQQQQRPGRGDVTLAVAKIGAELINALPAALADKEKVGEAIHTGLRELAQYHVNLHTEEMKAPWEQRAESARTPDHIVNGIVLTIRRELAPDTALTQGEKDDVMAQAGSLLGTAAMKIASSEEVITAAQQQRMGRDL